jgi:alkanesulfonate monooxygenase SsuD/methylene tetrahydromethanopterin reductase-like flavin-dependent oxidoreductase (luciferase family)
LQSIGRTRTIGAMRYVFPMPHTHRIAAIRQPWEDEVTGPQQALLARRAEAMGYDMLRIPEHHAIPRENVELSGAQRDDLQFRDPRGRQHRSLSTMRNGPSRR